MYISNYKPLNYEEPYSVTLTWEDYIETRRFNTLGVLKVIDKALVTPVQRFIKQSGKVHAFIVSKDGYLLYKDTVQLTAIHSALKVFGERFDVPEGKIMVQFEYNFKSMSFELLTQEEVDNKIKLLNAEKLYKYQQQKQNNK